jgi:DNA (cytosine-5)-methyltransferase 1
MPSIAIPEATKQGFALAEEGDGVYLNRPEQKRGVVQKGMIQTLKTSGDDLGVVVQHNNDLNNGLRIRKLTERECGRLMGVFDEDITKMQNVVSRSQMYKQFGNGIVVDVFAAILKNLF